MNYEHFGNLSTMGTHSIQNSQDSRSFIRLPDITFLRVNYSPQFLETFNSFRISNLLLRSQVEHGPWTP